MGRSHASAAVAVNTGCALHLRNEDGSEMEMHQLSLSPLALLRLPGNSRKALHNAVAPINDFLVVSFTSCFSLKASLSQNASNSHHKWMPFLYMHSSWIIRDLRSQPAWRAGSNSWETMGSQWGGRVMGWAFLSHDPAGENLAVHSNEFWGFIWHFLSWWDGGGSERQTWPNMLFFTSY